MKGYIGQFFGCMECRVNFLKMTVSINEEVREADDAILWLWRGHNKANERLHDDPSEDPHHPKIQFPESIMCSECWTSHRGKLVCHEDNVLKYLKKFYSRYNIIQDSKPYKFEPMEHSDNEDQIFDPKFHPKGYKILVNAKDDTHPLNLAVNDRRFNQNHIERLRQQELDTRFIHSRAAVSWGFTSMDLSICVLFYLICIAIIVLGYFHLTVNKRMNLFVICKKYNTM